MELNHENNRGRKSRDTLPLRGVSLFPQRFYRFYMSSEFWHSVMPDSNPHPPNCTASYEYPGALPKSRHIFHTFTHICFPWNLQFHPPLSLPSLPPLFSFLLLLLLFPPPLLSLPPLSPSPPLPSRSPPTGPRWASHLRRGEPFSNWPQGRHGIAAHM